MKLCIIGAGASGILLLLLLHQANINMKDIVIVDPHFDGGALQRSWATVISNTPWIATIEAIQTYLPSYTIPKWALEIPSDKPTPLAKIAQLLRDLSAPLMSSCKKVKGTVKELHCDSEWSNWKIIVQSAENTIHLQSDRIILAQGAVPKYFDYSVPAIPLEIALDPRRLQSYIQPNDTVLVFGTSHSGILVMKNLVDCSASSVIGIYRGPKPFLWARDGDYTGVKLEAATIADDIVDNKYPSIQLIPFENIYTMIQETRKATWAVFSMGFTLDTQLKIFVDSTEFSTKNYDPHSGKISSVPNAWGFGIAYPSRAPDGVNYDVGISSFLEYFSKQIPSIICNLNNT